MIESVTDCDLQSLNGLTRYRLKNHAASGDIQGSQLRVTYFEARLECQGGFERDCGVANNSEETDARRASVSSRHPERRATQRGNSIGLHTRHWNSMEQEEWRVNMAHRRER